MIELKDVSKAFGEETAVQSISLSIEEGKTYSLIGPSGCGKSTLIRLILGLIEPDSGSISIDGNEITKDNILKNRQKIGYVIQNGGLFPHLTARDNCTLVADFLGWTEVQKDIRLEFLCNLTKIDQSDLGKFPHEFSGGQRQRIGLIRALMLNPEILLLDEPLGSIDPLVRFELQEDLKEIFKSLDKTVLLVTHDLGEAGYLGDKIILMNNGQIIQKGTVSEIINKPENSFVKKFVTAQRNHLEEIE